MDEFNYKPSDFFQFKREFQNYLNEMLDNLDKEKNYCQCKDCGERLDGKIEAFREIKSTYNIIMERINNG